MPQNIDPNQSVLDVHSWWSGGVDLSELKTWVDTQIAQGKKKVSVNVDWGYYNDIDAIHMEAK